MPYQTSRTPIGQRRNKVTLQEAVMADDGMGGQSVTKWRTVAEPWASVVPLDERTRESEGGAQLTAQHGYHVDIRYVSGITPQMRVVWGDKTLEVHTVVDDEARG